MKRFLRLPELSEHLGIPSQTLRDWQAAGIISAFQPAGPRGALLFDPAQVESEIKARPSRAGQAPEVPAAGGKAASC